MSYILVRYERDNRLEIRTRKKERISETYCYTDKNGEPLKAVVIVSSKFPNTLEKIKIQMENKERFLEKEQMSPEKEQESNAVKKQKERSMKKKEKSSEKKPEKRAARAPEINYFEENESSSDDETLMSLKMKQKKSLEKKPAKKQKSSATESEESLTEEEEEENLEEEQEKRPTRGIRKRYFEDSSSEEEEENRRRAMKRQIEKKPTRAPKIRYFNITDSSSDEENLKSPLANHDENLEKEQEKRQTRAPRINYVEENESSSDDETLMSLKMKQKKSLEKKPAKKQKSSAIESEENLEEEQEKRWTRAPRKKYFDTSSSEEDENKKGREREGRKDRHQSHYCLFCEKKIGRINTHFTYTHRDEPQVKEIMATKDRGRRLLMWNILVAKGDLIYNTKVLEGEGGELIAARKVKSSKDFCKLVPCDNCWLLIKKDTFSDHRRHCSKLGKNDEKPPKIMENINDDGFYEEVIKDMKFGISDIILAKKLYYSFGRHLWMEKGYRNSKEIKQKLRYLKSLEEELQGAGRKNGLQEFLVPKCLDHVIATIKKMTGFQRVDRKLVIKYPSKVLKLTNLVVEVASYEKVCALKSEDEERAKQVANFIAVFQTQTAKALKGVARKYMRDASEKKLEDLPTVDDVWIIIRHIEEEAVGLLTKLRRWPEESTWVLLRDNLVTWTGLFNRRRGGASEKLKLADYYRARKIADKDLQRLKNPTEEEMKFLKSLLVADIQHKEHTVKVFIPKLLQEAIKTLVAYRSAAGISEKNEYVFAAVGESRNPVRATNVFVKYRNLLPPGDRQKMTYTNLRKQGATLVRTLDLDDNDLETWAGHMGHSRQIQERYYTLKGNPECLLKTGKILSLLRNGSLRDNVGKKLDDIQMDLDTELPTK